ncbi:FtsX-like permease family protein [Kitasatospora sp. NPDC004240]
MHGAQTAPMGQGGRYGALPGGDRLIPVVRQEQSLPNGAAGQILALDAKAVAERVPVRPDLLDGQDRGALFTRLAEPAPTGPQAGVPLPGRPLRIEADLTVRTTEHAGPTFGFGSDATVRLDLWLMLRDRYGNTYRIAMASVPDDGPGRATADLSALVDAPLGSVAAPLTLAGLTVGYGSQEVGTLGGELTVHRIAVADSVTGPATAVEVPAGLGWNATAPAQKNGTPSAAVLPATQTPTAPGPAGPELLKLRHHPDGGSARTLRAIVTPTGAPAPQEVPGLATHAYLSASGTKVGELVRVPFGTATVGVRITGAVESLPVAGGTAIVVDLATTGRLLAAAGQDLPATGEWWLPATGPGDRTPAEAAAALRAAAGAPGLVLREEVADDLLDDPVGAAPQSALAAIAVVTAVLAAIGFAAAGAAAARERAGEFSVLLALGTPRRRLRRTAAAEQGILVGLGSLVGLGLGALIVHLIVPLVVLTPAAHRPVPEVVVDLPPGPALLLAAAIAAVPLLAALAGGRGRRDVAARLRHLEEM